MATIIGVVVMSPICPIPQLCDNRHISPAVNWPYNQSGVEINTQHDSSVEREPNTTGRDFHNQKWTANSTGILGINILSTHIILNVIYKRKCKRGTTSDRTEESKTPKSFRY